MLNWLKQRLGFDDTEAEVNTLRAKSEQLRTEVNSLKEMAEQLKGEIDTLKKMSEKLTEQVAIEFTKSKLDALNQGLESIEYKITSNNDSQEGKLDNMKRRMESLESKIDIDHHAVEQIISSTIARQVEDKLGHAIILTSPDGKQSISIIANNTYSGIWITGQKDEPLVALYKMAQSQGAAVGIYGPADRQGQRRGGMDACFYYATSGDDPGGAIQLLTADNRPQLLELAVGDFVGGSTKLSDVKYVGYIPPDITE